MFEEITTRKSHTLPFGRARLVSLDSNYTYEYNYNYEIVVTQFTHLLSECKLSHKGANLVANTPRNYIQISNNTPKNIITNYIFSHNQKDSYEK